MKRFNICMPESMSEREHARLDVRENVREDLRVYVGEISEYMSRQKQCENTGQKKSQSACQ